MKENLKEIAGRGILEQKETEITEREISVPSVCSCSKSQKGVAADACRAAVRKLLRTGMSALLPALIAVLNLIPADCEAATITVTSTADSGAGTLRAALASAANGDTIDASGVTGTILLTSGELLVTNSVTILGPGPANLAVNGDAVSRVFHIALSNTVTIASLTITNGKTSGGYPTSSGGGIYNYHSTLTVSNCTLSGNSAPYGGSIYNDGYSGSATLVVSTSTLSSNSVSGSGGGIYNDGTSSGNAMLTVSA